VSYSDEKVANRDNKVWVMDKSKPLGAKIDSGTIYNRAEGFWIRPSSSRRAKP
jgi:hypothetical protein